MAVPYEEMQQLVGRPFPGGTFTIERWENFLLHDVFTAPEPSDGLAHPMYAFHGPLAAMGMTFAEFFELCRAESDDAVRAGTYDFQYFRPLREGETYEVRGEITGVERKRGRRAGLFDMVSFRLEMVDASGEVALSSGNTWLFLRSEDDAEAAS